MLVTYCFVSWEYLQLCIVQSETVSTQSLPEQIWCQLINRYILCDHNCPHSEWFVLNYAYKTRTNNTELSMEHYVYWHITFNGNDLISHLSISIILIIFSRRVFISGALIIHKSSFHGMLLSRCSIDGYFSYHVTKFPQSIFIVSVVTRYSWKKCKEQLKKFCSQCSYFDIKMILYSSLAIFIDIFPTG